MIDLRPFDKLGAFANDWLDTRYHFSFSHYHDPERMGLGRLRVWNDDAVAAGRGFDPHPHRDMEIITYVRSGAISHRDSLGNHGKTSAGEVQVMHAGTGITHAEYNEGSEPVSLFQIWILPDRAGAKPGWATRHFPQSGGLAVLASGRPSDAETGALSLNADAAVVAGTLAPGETVRRRLGPGRAAYLVAASGSVRVNGVTIDTRDGAAITGEEDLVITANDTAELVLVDVAA
jgi:redox-sensitive bicupin YhaK (pirin superfamily)